MKRFLIDAKLLPLVEKADNGDAEAQLELMFYYGKGENGTPKDIEWAKHYAYKLTEHYPKDIRLFWKPEDGILCYSKIYSFLAREAYKSRQYKESLKWLRTCENYCRNYSEEIYTDLIKRRNVKEDFKMVKSAIRAEKFKWLKKLWTWLLPITKCLSRK